MSFLNGQSIVLPAVEQENKSESRVNFDMSQLMKDLYEYKPVPKKNLMN